MAFSRFILCLFLKKEKFSFVCFGSMFLYLLQIDIYINSHSPTKQVTFLWTGAILGANKFKGHSFKVDIELGLGSGELGLLGIK